MKCRFPLARSFLPLMLLSVLVVFMIGDNRLARLQDIVFVCISSVVENSQFCRSAFTLFVQHCYDLAFQCKRLV